MNQPSSPSILVAEDEASVREFIVRGLGSAGYRVTAVEDGEQALQALSDHAETTGASFDLLITDIVMPHMDGIALALKVARDHPRMKIVMISGYADARARAHNLEALIHLIMAKPFSLQELLDMVKATLAG